MHMKVIDVKEPQRLAHPVILAAACLHCGASLEPKTNTCDLVGLCTKSFDDDPFPRRFKGP